MTTTTECGKCGSPLDAGSAFCTNCGNQTGDPSAATVALSSIPTDPLLVQLREELKEDYEVEKEVGRGGMAIVYRGKERMLERTVAIKVLPPEMAQQGDTAARFKREARLAASLDHQNIIPIYRVGQKDKLYYMAMKFVEGRALDDILEVQGALPFSVVMKLLEATASALAFAHDRKIIHRDIKGGNILVDSDGRVLVSDFGIARAMGETSLTASGMVIGTPNYMSPEQCGGQQLGPQADQYSLGVLAFQMLSGQLPFEADSIMGVIQHHYLTPVPDLTQVRKGTPEDLLAIVYRLMEKKPADRFESTHDLVDTLAAVPVTDVEKREAGGLLRELSKGVKIDLVRTGSLPPLRLTQPGGKIPSGLKRASKALEQKKKKKSKLPLVLIILVLVLGGGGVGAWQAGLLDSFLVPATLQESVPAAPTTGSLAFAGLPDGATINIGGQIFTGHTLADLAPGTYEYTVRAGGYENYTNQASVIAGQATPVTPRLQRVRAGPANTPPRARPRPQEPVALQPTGTATLNVSLVPGQLSAQIFVDGERVGSGRVMRHSISAGVPVQVRIELSGFVTFDTTFTAQPNQTVNLAGRQLREAGN